MRQQTRLQKRNPPKRHRAPAQGGRQRPELDAVDKKILVILQRNARMPNTEIARRIGMVPSGVFERLRRLEESGVIRGYETRIDPAAVDLGLVAFVFVKADPRAGSVRTASRLATIPEVQEVHHVAGEDCYLLKVRTADTESLGELLRDRIGRIKSVRSTRTTIVLGTTKETGSLALPASES